MVHPALQCIHLKSAAKIIKSLAFFNRSIARVRGDIPTKEINILQGARV